MIDLKDKRVLVVGAGLSGIAATGLLRDAGAHVILFDSDPNGRLSEGTLRDKLPAAFDGEIVLGELSAEQSADIDLAVISPGVPKDIPLVEGFRSRGIRIIGEIELGYWFSHGSIIGVTGTNGKTTTTALTGHIMKEAGRDTIVVGNIGTPYTTYVRATHDDTVTVAELSSFQLDTTETFTPHVSMILNITPDHLDRHHSMENYIAAKFMITANQTDRDVCILNHGDATLREWSAGLTVPVIWFSSSEELESGYFVRDGRIMHAADGRVTEILELDRMQLIGIHNYENVMAAVAAAEFMGVPTDVVREAVYSFKPVAHRIEYVRTVNGVRYYNDSKGTNPDAAIRAVRAMTGPTLLIGGGYDKGSEYDEWIESFEGRIRQLVLMGQTRDKIAACARKHGFDAITYVESMEEAVAFCSSHASAGDTVLLSPCCASWGMFKNYEERGDIFKDLVNRL